MPRSIQIFKLNDHLAKNFALKRNKTIQPKKKNEKKNSKLLSILALEHIDHFDQSEEFCFCFCFFEKRIKMYKLNDKRFVLWYKYARVNSNCRIMPAKYHK